MTKLFHKDKPLIGLDISSTDMKVMSIDLKRQFVTGYGVIDLDPLQIKKSLDEDTDYLLTSLETLLQRKLVGNLLSDQVVLGIPTARTFSRTFTIPLSAERTLKEAVAIEVVVSPDIAVDDHMALMIAVSAPELNGYFNSSGGG